MCAMGLKSKDLNFFLSQLPSRQEPTLDSSKYTAADVRIVSRLFIIVTFFN